MSTDQIPLADPVAEERNQQIHRDLRSLGWHDWTLWVLALIVILSMTATLATVLTSQSGSDDSFFQLNMSVAMRGLLGLVLIFSAYTFYQQLQLRKIRARLAKQVEIATQQHERAEQILALATPDSLTGLYNQRFAQIRLASDIARARRNGSPLTVLMLGLDNLGQINDRYGRAAGDSALRTLAETLNRAIRGCDLAVLTGRGDIMVVLPDCQIEQAPTVVKRLPKLKIEVGGNSVPLTLTVSSTAYKPNETSDEFSQRAVQALDAQRRVPTKQPHPVS
ncbi:MAG: GGDEF domain-containing protein [Candidatus Acidiferrales bacterium]